MLLRRPPRIRFLLSQSLLPLLAALALCGGCAMPGVPDHTVLVPRGAGSNGVAVRQLEDAGSRVTVMDVDLRTPGIQLEILSEDARRGGATVSGRARTVADWVTKAAALGGINAAFFGRDLG